MGIKITASGNECSACMAVSYTHLDVYKRQAGSLIALTLKIRLIFIIKQKKKLSFNMGGAQKI